MRYVGPIPPRRRGTTPSALPVDAHRFEQRLRERLAFQHRHPMQAGQGDDALGDVSPLPWRSPSAPPSSQARSAGATARCVGLVTITVALGTSRYILRWAFSRCILRSAATNLRIAFFTLVFVLDFLLGHVKGTFELPALPGVIQHADQHQSAGHAEGQANDQAPRTGDRGRQAAVAQMGNRAGRDCAGPTMPPLRRRRSSGASTRPRTSLLQLTRRSKAEARPRSQSMPSFSPLRRKPTWAKLTASAAAKSARQQRAHHRPQPSAEHAAEQVLHKRRWAAHASAWSRCRRACGPSSHCRGCRQQRECADADEDHDAGGELGAYRELAFFGGLFAPSRRGLFCFGFLIEIVGP